MRYDNTISLLLLLCRTRITEETIMSCLGLVKEGIDWGKFIDASRVHGVAPLIYKNITSIKGVPEGVISSLEKTYLGSIRNSALISHEIRELTELFSGGGIEFLLLKGPADADELYGNAALYPSADIDILIRADDIYRAAALMENAGYSAGHEISPYYLKNYRCATFLKEGKKAVEMHLSLGKPRYFDIPEDFWWKDAREKNIGGCAFKTLSKENGILFAAIHLFLHGYSPLKFIVSLSEMLRAYGDGINWKKLIEDSSKTNTYMPLMLSLDMASSLLDAHLPEEILQKLKNLSLKERFVHKKIKGYVFSKNARFSLVMFLLTLLQYNAFEVFLMMVRWMLPSMEEVSYRYNVPLNSKKLYLYYILNPFLLLLKKKDI
jgi:hypothetical protein